MGLKSGAIMTQWIIIVNTCTHIEVHQIKYGQIKLLSPDPMINKNKEIRLLSAQLIIDNISNLTPLVCSALWVNKFYKETSSGQL